MLLSRAPPKGLVVLGLICCVIIRSLAQQSDAGSVVHEGKGIQGVNASDTGTMSSWTENSNQEPVAVIYEKVVNNSEFISPSGGVKPEYSLFLKNNSRPFYRKFDKFGNEHTISRKKENGVSAQPDMSSIRNELPFNRTTQSDFMLTSIPMVNQVQGLANNSEMNASTHGQKWNNMRLVRFGGNFRDTHNKEWTKYGKFRQHFAIIHESSPPKRILSSSVLNRRDLRLFQRGEGDETEVDRLDNLPHKDIIVRRLHDLPQISIQSVSRRFGKIRREVLDDNWDRMEFNPDLFLRRRKRALLNRRRLKKRASAAQENQQFRQAQLMGGQGPPHRHPQQSHLPVKDMVHGMMNPREKMGVIPDPSWNPTKVPIPGPVSPSNKQILVQHTQQRQQQKPQLQQQPFKNPRFLWPSRGNPGYVGLKSYRVPQFMLAQSPGNVNRNQQQVQLQQRSKMPQQGVLQQQRISPANDVIKNSVANNQLMMPNVPLIAGNRPPSSSSAAVQNMKQVPVAPPTGPVAPKMNPSVAVNMIAGVYPAQATGPNNKEQRTEVKGVRMIPNIQQFPPKRQEGMSNQTQPKVSEDRKDAVIPLKTPLVNPFIVTSQLFPDDDKDNGEGMSLPYERLDSPFAEAAKAVNQDLVQQVQELHQRLKKLEAMNTPAVRHQDTPRLGEAAVAHQQQFPPAASSGNPSSSGQKRKRKKQRAKAKSVANISNLAKEFRSYPKKRGPDAWMIPKESGSQPVSETQAANEYTLSSKPISPTTNLRSSGELEDYSSKSQETPSTKPGIPYYSQGINKQGIISEDTHHVKRQTVTTTPAVVSHPTAVPKTDLEETQSYSQQGSGASAADGAGGEPGFTENTQTTALTPDLPAVSQQEALSRPLEELQQIPTQHQDETASNPSILEERATPDHKHVQNPLLMDMSRSDDANEATKDGRNTLLVSNNEYLVPSAQGAPFQGPPPPILQPSSEATGHENSTLQTSKGPIVASSEVPSIITAPENSTNVSNFEHGMP